jgi:polyhydroxyalkanoate synthesis regulator phasin
MSEKAPVTESKPDGADAPAAPVVRRSPGHRGQDVRDTVAEMAARAHEISLEAGSKMAAAMKDVINAAAGLTGFAIESARDLVQYMVRRGQMTQDEADKLIREAEEAHGKRPGAVTARPSYVAPDHAAAKAARAAEKTAAAAAAALAPPPAPAKPVAVAASAPAAAPVVAKAPPAKAPAAKAPAAKKVAAASKKPVAAKGAMKRPAVAKASAKPAKKK